MKKLKAPTEPTAPKSAEAKRVAAIFHRRPETKWSVGEIKKYLALHPVDVTELALLERYYKWHWPPCRDKNHLRHDLETFLNHWQGELDKARAWTDRQEARPNHAPRKIIPLPPPPETELTGAERAQFAADYEKLMGRKWKGQQ